MGERCVDFNGGVMMVGTSSFPDADIARARRYIARKRRVPLARVDEFDAECYLREEAEADARRASHPVESAAPAEGGE